MNTGSTYFGWMGSTITDWVKIGFMQEGHCLAMPSGSKLSSKTKSDVQIISKENENGKKELFISIDRYIDHHHFITV